MKTTLLHHHQGRSVQGLTLFELLVAATITAVMVVSLARVTALFGTQVEHLRAEDDQALERAVIDVAERVRYAWLVDRPDASTLAVEDAVGRTSLYTHDASAATLTVTTPTGATGSVLQGVAAVDFSVQTTRRLRDSTPTSSYGEFWSATFSGTGESLTVSGDDRLAIAFTVPTRAPDDAQLLSDVTEEYLETTLETLTLPAAYIDTRDADFCHLFASGPPHDDYHGCEPKGKAVIELYAARSPTDARPHGPLLASAQVSASGLTSADWDWVDSTTGTSVSPPSCGGANWTWWANRPEVVLDVDSPGSTVCLDVSPLGTLTPGRSYVLVFRMSGHGMLVLRSTDVASASGSGVARNAGTGWSPWARKPHARLKGTRQFTQTEAHDVISRVTTTIDMVDGRRLSGTAHVQSQLNVENPWYGPIPGDYPTLATAP